MTRAPSPLLAGLCLGLVLLPATFGCTRAEAPDSAKPLVVVSVLPQAFVVERIAAGLVNIEVMIPPGGAPATFEPGIDKLRAMDRASLYIKVGHPDFPFEAAWLDRLIEGRPSLTVVDSSSGVERRDGDPHVWLSPAIMKSIAGHVHAALREVLPGARATLAENLEILLAEIESVDRACADILAPVRGRRFFVFHPAWGYFADDYGLVQTAIEEHGKEPDAHHLGELVEDARAAGVKVVFAQPQMSEASALLVAEEIGARVERLDPLAYEWADNLERAARAIAAGAVP